MYTISILILSLIAVREYGPIPPVKPDEDFTSLCSLVARPNDWAGKTVKLKAILSAGEEFQILKDDSCPPRPNRTSGKSDLVEVTFEEGYNTKSAVHRKLIKLLESRGQAQVRVVAKFLDRGHYFGAQGCCRYQLRVQRLTSAEKVPEHAKSEK